MVRGEESLLDELLNRECAAETHQTIHVDGVYALRRFDNSSHDSILKY